MGFKDMVWTQIYRLQRVAAPISLILLTLNLSLTAYSLIAWRDISPWLAVSLIFLGVGGTVLLAANANILVLGMHVHERRVANRHNPNALYAFTPKEMMMQRTMQVPMMRALGLEEQADKLSKWNKLGYIPKEDFDSDLAAYYVDAGVRV